MKPDHPAVPVWRCRWQPWPGGPQPFAAVGLVAAWRWLNNLDKHHCTPLAVDGSNHPSLVPLIQACLISGVELELVPPGADQQTQPLPDWPQQAKSTEELNCLSIVPTRPITGAIWLYSSGTSSGAKRIRLSAAQCWQGAARCVDWLAPLGPESTWCCCLGLDHLGGLSQVLRGCYIGYDLLLMARFSAETIQQRWLDIDGLSLVPTMLQRLLGAGWQPAGEGRQASCDSQHIQAETVVLLGGAPCQTALWHQAKQLPWDVRRCYAATEYGGTVAGEDPRRPAVGNAGWLLPGITARITEHCLELSGIMIDHHQWWRSKDRARIEADGSLSILGRSDDIILSGGLNLDPQPIAEQLHQHPAVAEAVVVGVDDAEWGQRVAAALVQDPDHPRPTEDAWQRWLGDQFAGPHRPKSWLWLDQLPRNQRGKIDLQTIRQRLSHSIRNQ